MWTDLSFWYETISCLARAFDLKVLVISPVEIFSLAKV